MLQPQTAVALTGIGKILESNRLEVPVHQRAYSWELDEITEFIQDIDSAIEADSREYFLGSIVVQSAATDRSGCVVLDGQQRLATVTVILNEIARMLEAIGDSTRANEIRRLFISKVDLSSGEARPQFTLNSVDDPYFRTVLGASPMAPPTGAPDSHRRLYALQDEVSRWIKRRTDTSHNRTKELVTLAEFLQLSATVIFFTVPDDANAYLIFETLNDRGLELSIRDLLKNYLLGRAGRHKDEVLTAWTSSIASLRTENSEASFTMFLRHYWSSKYEVVRERHIYRGVKLRITTDSSVLEFARELQQSSNHYAAIIYSDHEFWTGMPPDAAVNIRTLSLLGLEQFRPLLLSAMAHFEPKELSKLLRMLISWNVRLLIVGGLGGGAMESNYSRLGQEIRRGALKSSAEVGRRAKDFIPNDSAFLDRFSIAEVSKTQLARYYLTAMELQLGGKVEPELVPNPDSSKLTLEHVLPDKPEGNWPQFSADDHDRFVRRIGNMVLLAKRLNSKARSEPFDKKRAFFASSELRLTHSISENENWTRESIEKRQVELAKLAIKTWPLGTT